MSEIRIEQKPDVAHLTALGVFSWPIWTKEVSTFPWTYGEKEVCYILEGEILVTPDGQDPVKIITGNLVTFPAGMSCIWNIQAPVRKHYKFG